MAQSPPTSSGANNAASSPRYYDLNAPLTRPVTPQQVTGFTLREGMLPSLVVPDGSLYFGPLVDCGRYRVPCDCGIIFFRHGDGMAPNFMQASATPGGTTSSGGGLVSYFFGRGVPQDLGALRGDDQRQAAAQVAAAFTSLCARYQQGDRYGGDWAGGVFHGEGVLITSFFTYQGGWHAGSMHGRGYIAYTRKYVDARPAAAGGGGGAGVGTLLLKGLSYVTPFGLVSSAAAPKEYTGDFHAEHGRHGAGLMRYYNGDVYEGQWQDNCRHGKGKLRRPDGEMYEGEWANDVREGFGKILYPNGSVFKGLMRQDMRDGEGVMRFTNGDEYFGGFVADRIEGHGTMKYRNGDTYDGAWHDQLRHGKGAFTLKRTGATMTGIFQNGLIHGEATVVVPRVSTFVGTFVRGERTVGTMHWHPQMPSEGEKAVDSSAAATPSPPPADLPLAASTGTTVAAPVATGSTSLGQAARRHYLCYQGEWHGEHMHGRGLLWYTNGDFFSGRFQKSLRHGPGNMRYFAEQAEFSGTFVHGVRHGLGLLQRADGSIRAGRWQHDSFAEGYEGEWDGSTFNGIGRLTMPLDTFFGVRASNSTLKLTDISAILNEASSPPPPPPANTTPAEDEARASETLSPTSAQPGGAAAAVVTAASSAVMRRNDIAPHFIDFFGVFRNGVRDGLGLLKLPALDCLVGGTLNLAEDRRPIRKTSSASGADGAAASVLSDGDVASVVIKGRWVREVLHCEKGVIAFPNGTIYIGGFRNGARDAATARVWWPDGSVMESAWRDDAPSGAGVWYQRNRTDPIFQTIIPSALRRSRSRRTTTETQAPAPLSAAATTAALVTQQAVTDTNTSAGDLFGLSYLWGLVGLGFGGGGGHDANGAKENDGEDARRSADRPQRVLIDFHGHFAMSCTWNPYAMDLNTYSRVVLPQVAAQTAPLPNGTPWPLVMHSGTMATAMANGAGWGLSGAGAASASSATLAAAAAGKSVGNSSMAAATATSFAAPESPIAPTTRQIAAGAAALHLSEPPPRIPVGRANGAAVVYFESGVVLAGEWLSNVPRLAVPYRPWSAYDTFLVWQASRPAARNCMRAFPLWVAPRLQSCYSGLLATAPDDVRGEPRRTTPGEPHHPASMAFSPLATSGDGVGAAAATSAGSAGEGVRGVTSPDTRCTICAKEYSFFRKRVHCTLCLRSTCTSCLGQMDTDGRRQEDVKAVLRHAYVTSETATQLAAAAAKSLAASNSNNSSNPPRRVVFPSVSVEQVERAFEAQNISTVPVCADCVRAMLWKLRYTQLWVPMSMFASVVDIERHQRDMQMRIKGSAQRIDVPASGAAEGVDGEGPAVTAAAAAAAMLSRESSRQLSTGGELLPLGDGEEARAEGGRKEEENSGDVAQGAAPRTPTSANAGEAAAQTPFPAHSREGADTIADPIPLADSPSPHSPPTQATTGAETTNRYARPLPDMPRPSGELLPPTQYITYSGYTSHSIPHIYGELWWGRRYYYRGGFCAGERHGFGVQYMPNGERYEGAFERDAWHGQGVYYFDDGSVLLGEFRRGELHIVQYHGEVEEDAAAGVRPHGRGVGYEADGSLYNGEWSHGQRHGTGMLHFPDGVSVYSGTFVANAMEGMGKLVTTSGAYYGDFSQNQQQGKGLLFTGTCVIEGSWVHGASSGFTRIYESDTGEVYETTSRDGNERDDCFSAPLMIDDAEAAECGQCGTAFTFFLRRHHCRLCGDVFCDSCSQHRATLPANFGGDGDTGANAEGLDATINPSTVGQRVCDACFYRLTQRRMIGVRRYRDGSVYAGCWSQGRWVAQGLYCRPDGIYVVMDHHGKPLVSANLSRAKMGALAATESGGSGDAGADEGGAGSKKESGKRAAGGGGGVPAGGLGVPRRPARTMLPISPSILQDASPAKELLDNVRVVRESSSRGDLDNFLLWWATTRSRCGLQVPLDVLLVSKYQRMPAQLLRGGKSTTVAVGSDAAAYLAGPTRCALATPHTPSLAPIRLFVTLADARKAMQTMVDGEVRRPAAERDATRETPAVEGKEGESAATSGASLTAGATAPRLTAEERRVIDSDVEAAALRASRFMPVAIPRAPTVPITSATMPTISSIIYDESPALSSNASTRDLDRASDADAQRSSGGGASHGLLGSGGRRNSRSTPLMDAEVGAFGLSTWATRPPPTIDAEDITDERLVSMMRAERLGWRGTAAGAMCDTVGALMPPTPTPPALGENTPIAWDVWATRDIPRYAPPPLTSVGSESDNVSAGVSSPTPASQQQQQQQQQPRSEVDLYFACPFWEPAVPDVQMLLEQGKMTQAARLMRKLQREHASGDGADDDERDADGSPWGSGTEVGSFASAARSPGTAKDRATGSTDTLDVLQQMQVANGTGTGMAWTAGGLLSAEQRAQSGGGWAPAPMHGPFEFDISATEKKKSPDGERWYFKVNQREIHNFQ